MKIEHITVYGAGLIGCGWITHLLLKGYKNIVVYDLDEEKISKAKVIIRQNLSSIGTELELQGNQVDAYLETPTFTTDMVNALSLADWVIENGPENLT